MREEDTVQVQSKVFRTTEAGKKRRGSTKEEEKIVGNAPGDEGQSGRHGVPMGYVRARSRLLDEGQGLE
jgi:hypothetical protein